MLAETSLSLLGVLAGLNRRYFSPVQFKRLRPFVATLTVAPDRLAERLDALFTPDTIAAASSLERLATETVDLVETVMPDVDTAAVRRYLGQRHER